MCTKDGNCLAWPFSRCEIWDALPLLGLGKNLSLDGFTIEFYRFYRNIISYSLVQAFHSFYDHTFLPTDWFKNFIAFISKIKIPTKVKDFRPISLCNVNYCILAKVLANRIKPHLKSLISCEQFAFIQEHSVYDNILIA